MKRHMFEGEFSFRHLERLGVGAVLDLGALAKNREHHFDINNCLPELAVDDTHEIERLIKLNHHRIDEDEIANRIRAVHNAMDAHRHRYSKPKREYDGLARIEESKRGVCLHAHAFVAG